MLKNGKKYDLVVVGGGLAGVCAAISAARLGCKTALVQERPVLGGNSSNEIRVPVCGCGNYHSWGKETGIIEELNTEAKVRRCRLMEGVTNSIWDLTLYDCVKQEKNIDLFLNTSVRRAVMKGKNFIKGAACVQLGSEKEFILQANLFIDASGDGALAFSAGAKFRIGEESKKEFNESLAPAKKTKATMGNSLMFEARDIGYPVKFAPPSWAAKFPKEEDLTGRHHADEHGNVSTAGHWWIEVGFPYNTIDDNEKIKEVLLAQLMGLWDHIKNTGNHKAENLVLNWVGSVPGKRESRRFVGDYILTQNDVKNAVPFPDRIAYGGWYIDLHTIGGILKRQDLPEPSGKGLAEMERRWVYPYSIPYRCLYSKNISNLFMAGRNISVTHVALGTTRIMATCAMTGQTAGTATYLCKKYKLLPTDIFPEHIKELQQLLLKRDCYIPFIKNEDKFDLAKNAKISASSDTILDISAQGEKAHCFDIPRGQLFPVSEKKIDSVELYLENKSNQDKELELHLCMANHIWDYDIRKEIALSKAKMPAGSKNWVKFDFNLNMEQEKMYWVWIGYPTRRGGCPEDGWDKDIYWSYNEGIIPTGVTPVEKCMPVLWRSFPALHFYYSMKITPTQKPFKAQNVLNGVNRPEKWTNVWISDPEKGFPQSLELDFGKEVSFNRIEITFDTNLNSTFYNKEVLRNPESPNCVKDYTLYYKKEGGWERILEIKENYHRYKIHNFAPVKSSKLKLQINATNGSPSAHVYGVRVYNKKAKVSAGKIQ
ncbi:hypothetical protein COS91_08275 [Candidatus Desantisbacteria bacterium CG07_land_8_20_14_0_80_39_15]|uniref:Pyridine nucleotide-disulfide oxidoreductase n=1 Tax=Candidatus Desantisbacteria bacterium CG07_land_8_20_14_0_80_39_15 TaxID=1974549 RepID=A0A2M6ZE92_9BACT|nr:MAG: hypothetical protein COS91_08275 [Candidatus Desantisbacteria bacterium CG07_land_8_20_14_0_80_39_15]